jgi:hypothetical protein
MTEDDAGMTEDDAGMMEENVGMLRVRKDCHSREGGNPGYSISGCAITIVL